MEKLSENFCFAGRQLRFKHDSATLNSSQTFSIYLPPQAAQQSVPVLYWLSGLTCTDENFVSKAGAPMASPMRCPWGEKALGNYLGPNRESWRQYDTTELIAKASSHLPLTQN